MATRDNESVCAPFALLHQEHESLRELFRTLERNWPDAGPEARQTLIARLCRRLDMHAELEEELVYPVLEASAETATLAAGAADDHANMKAMTRQLESLPASDDDCLEVLRILADTFDQHVQEEEGILFDGLADAGIDLPELAERMEQRKAMMRDETMGVKPS